MICRSLSAERVKKVATKQKKQQSKMCMVIECQKRTCVKHSSMFLISQCFFLLLFFCASQASLFARSTFLAVTTHRLDAYGFRIRIATRRACMCDFRHIKILTLLLGCCCCCFFLCWDFEIEWTKTKCDKCFSLQICSSILMMVMAVWNSIGVNFECCLCWS